MKSERRLISTGSSFEETMAYSRAVVQGDWCFLSGVTGYDYETMKMPAAISDQAANCFQTIDKVLTEAGFSMNDIARVQYTVVKPDLVDQLSSVFGHYLGEIRPAATMIIAGLIKSEMLIEIEVTAFSG